MVIRRLGDNSIPNGEAMIYNTHIIKDRGTIAQLTAVQLMAPIMLLVLSEKWTGFDHYERDISVVISDTDYP